MALRRKIQPNKRESTHDEPRSKWTTPRLVVYGKVATLTQGVNGSNADPGQGNQTKLGKG